MTLNGAIKQLHDIRCSDDIPVYYKPAIAEVINVLLMDTKEVRHGEWLETEQPNGWTDVSCATCSVCGEDFVLGEMCMDDIRWGFKYCPNCGAKMDGGKDDGERKNSDFSSR